MELEELLIASIGCNIISMIAFVVCWCIQVRMNRNTISILSNFLDILKNFKDMLKPLPDSLNEIYLNLSNEISKVQKEIVEENKAAVFAVGLGNSILDLGRKKDVCNDNSEKQGRGNQVQGTEGDRPCRKYARRNNAA